MTKLSGIGAIFLCLPLLFLVNAAQGDEIVDQQQPVIVADAPTLAVGGSSEQKLAQSFTVGIAGPLIEIRLPVACSTGTLVVEIQSLNSLNFPSGITVASGHVAASDIGATFGGFKSISIDPRRVFPPASNMQSSSVTRRGPAPCSKALKEIRMMAAPYFSMRGRTSRAGLKFPNPMGPIIRISHLIWHSKPLFIGLMDLGYL